MRAVNYFIFFGVLFFFQCKEKNERILSFIENHKEKDFNEFKGYGVYRRGMNGSDRIIYVSKLSLLDSQTTSGGIKVIIDTNLIVKKIEKLNLRFSVGDSSVKRIAKNFLSFDISGLTVNYKNEAYFNIYSADKPDLMYSKLDSVEYLNNGWERLKKNWYTR